jgi:ribosomal protein S18 acetylase RimI-like enzyme
VKSSRSTSPPEETRGVASHPLDQPIWAALASRQIEFALGTRARRYQPDVEPFIAWADDEPETLAEVRTLIGETETVILLQADAVVLPPGVRLVGEETGVQMFAAAARLEPFVDDDIHPLGDRDVTEMIALARLTKPGPFRPRTHALGQFWGIREDGRLIAMAGERMKLPGHSEVSGVCVHPDGRGLGYARRLSQQVLSRIVARGETAFLHAYAANAPAIRLYESLGFVVRREMRVQLLARA